MNVLKALSNQMKNIRIIVVSGALLASSVTHAELIDLTPGDYDVNNPPPTVVGVGRVILRDASTNPNSIVKLAPGSDNWAITWSGVNNHQYLGFGDGGGFNGTNTIGRVSLGFSRIEGATGDSWTGFNVWGGFHPENPAQFGGKTRGILEYNGKLYAWRTPGSDATGYNEARLAVSTDNGAHWTLQGWAFTKATGIIFPSIMQAGRGYANAQDGYVYSFAVRLKDDSRLKNQVPGEIDLFRVPKGQITTRATYQFYAGTDQNGPIWVTNQAAREPVYSCASVSFSPPTVLYVPQLRSYIMVISYSGGIGSDHWGLLQAPKPWGPWTQFKNFTRTPFGTGNSNLFFFSISPKWISADGLQLHLIGTGFNTSPSNSDAFMKVKLTLVPQ